MSIPFAAGTYGALYKHPTNPWAVIKIVYLGVTLDEAYAQHEWKMLRQAYNAAPAHVPIPDEFTIEYDSHGFPHIAKMTMQFLDNVPQILTPRQQLEFMLEGLALIHGAGMAHRDIKPDNIKNNKFIDFGSACAWTDKGLCTAENSTPEFMPPESYTGINRGLDKLQLSQAHDVWSLGATFSKMFYKNMPNVCCVWNQIPNMHRGDVENKCRQVDCSRDNAFPDEIKLAYDPAIRDTLFRMLDPDVVRRPTAIDALTSLRHAIKYGVTVPTRKILGLNPKLKQAKR